MRGEIDLQKWSVQYLDSVARAEVAFGELARAQSVAKFIVRRLDSQLAAIRKERGCSYGVAFETLEWDERDTYLYAQSVLSADDAASLLDSGSV
jgi:hypothetical protein